ncbi:hypothetical protein ES703_82385 [subsurface metagenome]
MYVLNLSDCECVHLHFLITHLLSSLDINPITGKHELPIFKSIDLRDLDLTTLRTLQAKLDVCLV